MIIKGGLHIDDRGKITFVNDFDISITKRFYTIQHPNTEVIRAWQGHKIETKWFYVIKGSFKIGRVKIKDWDNPKINTNIETFILSEKDPEILQIEPGYANGFKALESESIVVIYSSLSLKESESDLIRFPENFWKL
jgi:dTDP-4-dehydrorhamnose 3,5-epimerase-like enzyme